MRLALVILCVWLLLPGSAPAAQQADASRIHFNRGVELQRKGDLEGARQAYEEALMLSPSRVDALANLGLVYLNLGRNENAIEVLSRAIDLKPELTSVRLFLGLARFRVEQFEAAHHGLCVPVNGRV